MLKRAVLAPIPSASAVTASAVKPGEFLKVLKAYLTSCHKLFISTSRVGAGLEFLRPGFDRNRAVDGVELHEPRRAVELNPAEIVVPRFVSVAALRGLAAHGGIPRGLHPDSGLVVTRQPQRQRAVFGARFQSRPLPAASRQNHRNGAVLRLQADVSAAARDADGAVLRGGPDFLRAAGQLDRTVLAAGANAPRDSRQADLPVLRLQLHFGILGSLHDQVDEIVSALRTAGAETPVMQGDFDPIQGMLR